MHSNERRERVPALLYHEYHNSFFPSSGAICVFRSKGSLFEGQSLLHIMNALSNYCNSHGRISISCNQSDYDVHMCMSLVSASRTANKLQYVALSS